MPVVWAPQALTDITRIALYIAAENPVAAVRIGIAVIRAWVAGGCVPVMEGRVSL